MGCTSSTSSQARQATENAKDLAVQLGLLRDAEKLDMRSVTMMMWRARDTPEVVGTLTELLTLRSDEKDVFDGIEFYLPQLVHMMLHLEVHWPTQALQQFALMIAQQSLHFALQMNWILASSMEDYQPEDDEGNKNFAANAELFMRCTTLTIALERAVVFGSPNCAELQRQYKEGKLSKEQLQDSSIKDRNAAAAKFVKDCQETKIALEGKLMYKKWIKTSRVQSKGWSERRFVIQNRVLMCFAGKMMLRAIPLAHTETKIVENPKYEFYFEVHELHRERVYKMRASNEMELRQWVEVLQSEAHAPPNVVEAAGGKKLTETQIARYGFYRSERDFVRDLTDICEDLRFVPIPERKPNLKAHLEKLEIPGCVYLPMTKSTAPWYRVVKVLPDKGHPFTTRARCPCLMTFEVIGDGDMDVANFLYQTLDSGSSNPSTESQRKFVKSARLIATATSPSNTNTASVEAPERDATRLQIAFSDADQKSGPTDHSLWAQEVKPEASASRHKGMFSGLRKKEQHDIGTKALNVFRNAAGGRLSMDEPTGALGSGSPNMGQMKSVSAAISHASEEDKRTASMRIQSMARVANPNQILMDRIIAKSNDDLRQEVFTMQLMQFLKDVWSENEIPIYLRTYRILSTSKWTGLLEVITNADSLDGVKKKLNEGKPNFTTVRLIEKYKQLYPDPVQFKAAQKRYLESLAGSSMASYILRLGDRHNGNIMLEMESGRLAHIDFGFVFGMRPGKDKIPHTDFSFERAAFKITSEMIEIIDGKGSPLWDEFVKTMYDALMAVRKKAQTLITLVEITGHKSMFPCFNQPGGGVKRVLRELKQRLFLDVPDHLVLAKVKKLAELSYQHIGTVLYERFQLRSNGIAPVY